MISTLGDELRFRLKTAVGGTATLISSGAALEPGVWTHVAATYDGQQMLLYKNGAVLATMTKTGAMVSNPAVATWIGDNPGGGRSVDGVVDGVRIYSRALSATDIQQVMSLPVVTVCGDGVLGPGEECDDGNLIDGDGCQSDCSITP